ncbi:MAG: TIM barrel protein [Nanoarchaeota archaeon]
MIRLGPGGNCDKDLISSIKRLPTLSLSAQEIEFTHGIMMKNELAKKAGEIAKEQNIALSIHAPYYINLNSEEIEKQKASMQRILTCCERAHYLGADPVVFHAGYYGKTSKEEAYETIKNRILEMHDEIKKCGWKTTIAPEIAGKHSSFGSVEEILRLQKETGCNACIDFAHLYAREMGKLNYPKLFDKLKPLKHIHAHFSGIAYTEKGEKNHEIMTEEFFMPLAKEIVKRKSDITIISESPITWKDSLKMKSVIEKLQTH